MTALSILTGGATVTVDLLTAIPPTNDVSSWQIATWLDYQSVLVVPTTVAFSNGEYFMRLTVPISVNVNEWTSIRAIGVSFQGIGLFFVVPNLTWTPGDLIVDFVLSPVTDNP